MSLYGYKKKTKPANWTTVPGAVVTQPAKKPAPIKRQKPVRRVSKALATPKRRYRARVKVWLVGAACVRCGNPATECHHKYGRRPAAKLLNWEPGWRPVCGGCHEWIHRNPERARMDGFIAPAGAWENFERAVICEAHGT